MIHDPNAQLPDNFPVHAGLEDPHFEDTYHEITLASHDTGSKDPVPFKCRIRRWVLNEDTRKPKLFLIPGIAPQLQFL